MPPASARNGGGYGAGDHVPQQLPFAPFFFRCEVPHIVAGLREAHDFSAEGRAQDLDPGTPKVKQDGEKCACVQSYVKREAGIAPIRQSQAGDEPGRECQMCGTGDRQEFGKPLHNA
jgi:hypothetical protein